MVAKYCNISLFQVLELEVYEFYFLLRDAFIYGYSQSESGREYLKKSWRLEQTESDVEGLRKHFEKKEGEN